MEFELVLASILAFLLLLAVALLCYARIKQKPVPNKRAPPPYQVLVVLGSGGHTAEMLALTSSLNSEKYYPTWVVADTDKTSLPKLKQADRGLAKSKKQLVLTIPRSREVGQSWISTIKSTLFASIHGIRLVIQQKPSLILLNGPGTCVPILLGALCLRVWYGGGPTSLAPKIIFIESFCRVDSLSLTGRICYPFADRFIVQWPKLKQRYGKAEYLGVIF